MEPARRDHLVVPPLIGAAPEFVGAVVGALVAGALEAGAREVVPIVPPPWVVMPVPLAIGS